MVAVGFVQPTFTSGFVLAKGFLVGPGANLTGATVTNGNLTNANLTGANLTNATFSGATGNPPGGATATYHNTTCPDATVVTGPATCVGHGFAS
jgi:uncharacterized protein YjbI with pentapeptide repeats